MNAHSIIKRGLLRQILDDDELKYRLEFLAGYLTVWTTAEDDPKTLQAKTVAATFLYVLLSVGNVEDFNPYSMELEPEAAFPVIALKFVGDADKLSGISPIGLLHSSVLADLQWR